WLQPCLLKIYSHMVTLWGNYEGISQQIASVKVQYLDKQKKLAVMNIEYN
ncbi:hypothetical protein ACEPQY_17255, partial [Escherichia coli]